MVMTVECPSCASTFPVDPAKVPEGGVNARCTSCSQVFRVERPAEPEGDGATWEAPPVESDGPKVAASPAAGDEVPEAALPGEPPATQADTESRLDPTATGAAAEDAWDTGAELAEPADDDAGAGDLPALDDQSAGDEAELAEPGPQADWEAWQGDADLAEEADGGAGEEPSLEASAPLTMDDTDDGGWGSGTAGGIHTPEPDPDVGEEAVQEEAEADDWVFETADEPTAEERGDDGAQDEEPGEDSFFMAGTEPAAAEDMGTSPETDEPVFDMGTDELELAEDEGEPDTETPSAEAPPEAAPTKPVQGFSFGQRDPADKARRLARVLVSDMIMYNPERHQRALANGTLKDDFEDEIAKSWKEYVEQVGAQMAEDTSYWTDALNDILAKGEPVF